MNQQQSVVEFVRPDNYWWAVQKSHLPAKDRPVQFWGEPPIPGAIKMTPNLTWRERISALNRATNAQSRG